MLVKLNSEPFFRVTANYGEIDNVHTVGHTGIDLAMKCGTPLPSVSDGQVINVYHMGKFNVGNAVKVENSDETQVIYGHMQSVDVNVGDHVHIGQIIGKSGNTGNSTGCHLHLGEKLHNHFVNPQHFADIMQQLGHDLLDITWSTMQCVMIGIGDLF